MMFIGLSVELVEAICGLGWFLGEVCCGIYTQRVQRTRSNRRHNTIFLAYVQYHAFMRKEIARANREGGMQCLSSEASHLGNEHESMEGEDTTERRERCRKVYTPPTRRDRL